MKHESAVSQINQLIAAPLEARGFDLVRVNLTGPRGHVTLQIMAEHKNGHAMTLEDCTQLSQTIDALMEPANILDAAYVLEVSSPGIDRPLIRPQDFSRFIGHMALIELREQHEGRRRFKGKIGKVIAKSSDEIAIEFATDEGSCAVSMTQIAKAKLVLTDALLKTSAKQAEIPHQS